jgi:hypothetical protein
MIAVAAASTLLGTLVLAAAVLAQDAPSSENAQSGGTQEQQAGQSAPVGAGSADAVTTGISGPEASSAGGEISVPSVPGEDLCQEYEGLPSYAPCLVTVTSERSPQ